MFSRIGKSSVISSLTWGLVLTVITVIVVFNVISYFIAARQMESDLHVKAADSVRELAGVLGVPMWNLDESTIRRTSQVYASFEDIVRIRVIDNLGATLYDYDVTEPGEQTISNSEPIMYGEQFLGQVEVVLSTDSIQDAQGSQLATALLSTLLVVVAIVVANQILLRRFLRRPLTEMIAGLNTIAQGDYSYRLKPFNKTDLDAIVESANAMAGQIADRDRQLRQLVDTLEDRVAARTRDLTVAQGVSRQVSSRLNRQELLEQLVELTQPAFGLYQVNIYQFEPEAQVLRLVAASGSAGAQMIAAGRQHRLDQRGLVPSAASRRQAVVSNDVTRSEDHLVNPLLPNTRSEAAIPILYADFLFGVLDLQSEKVDHFGQDVIELFQSFANQIAIAMRNAMLFEEAEASRARAEQADQVKSAFLASMSHELRTPLNAIINFSKFLKKEIPGPLNEEQGQLVGSIADSGQHLLNLINDVLDMSKIESGSLRLFIESDVDLHDILDTAIQYTEPILAEKPVEMRRDIAEVLPRLTGDRKRLLQIFLNILSNACRFTEQGHVTVTAKAESGHVLVSVADTGPGIAPEDVESVFTAFKQTSRGLRQGGGTGLGMPICQKLVEAHAGRIWFESQVGVGTTFFVELPLEPALQPERDLQHA